MKSCQKAVQNYHLKRKLTVQFGYTLIELMISVAIIGILAAIAIPSYMSYIGRTQTMEGFTVTDGLRSVIGLHVWENRQFPNSVDVAITGDIGEQADAIEGKYVAPSGVIVAPNTGVITISFDSGNIAGKTLVLTPKVNNSTNKQVVKWVCSGSVGADKLPLSCQD